MRCILPLKLKKAIFSLVNPRCWKALCFGVAPAIEHRAVLAGLKCDLVVDVGGNRGQFSLISRLVKPMIPIVAFEPIPAEATVYRQVNSGFGNIQLHQTALGEHAGEAEIHLSARADSSSLLPIGEMQMDLFQGTGEVGSLKIPVKRLDDFKSAWGRYSQILLKIDVQGFELSVLKGAPEALKHCAYVYVECSHIELYVGQPLFDEVAGFLKTQGFGVHSKHNESFSNGNLIQADYLFTRNGSQ